jgi:hypothetical protein
MLGYNLIKLHSCKHPHQLYLKKDNLRFSPLKFEFKKTLHHQAQSQNTRKNFKKPPFLIIQEYLTKHPATSIIQKVYMTSSKTYSQLQVEFD